jgi:hypothetical protein
VSATKKVVGASSSEKFVGSALLQSRAKLGTAWPWPRGAMAIILLSLLLWGGVAAIVLLAFN